MRAKARSVLQRAPAVVPERRRLRRHGRDEESLLFPGSKRRAIQNTGFPRRESPRLPSPRCTGPLRKAATAGHRNSECARPSRFPGATNAGHRLPGTGGKPRREYGRAPVSERHREKPSSPAIDRESQTRHSIDKAPNAPRSGSSMPGRAASDSAGSRSTTVECALAARRASNPTSGASRLAHSPPVRRFGSGLPRPARHQRFQPVRAGRLLRPDFPGR